MAPSCIVKLSLVKGNIFITILSSLLIFTLLIITSSSLLLVLLLVLVVLLTSDILIFDTKYECGNATASRSISPVTDAGFDVMGVIFCEPFGLTPAPA